MIKSNHWLQEEYIIDTPENVSFGFEVAGIGSRFIGALIDGFVLTLALLVLNLVVGFVAELVGGSAFVDPFGDGGDVNWTVGLILAAYALLNFLLVAGYYMIFELIWNGQTVGKRVAKIRVVRVNGSPAGFLEIVVRNLVRMVDFLPMAYGVGLIVMFFNRHARRLGDFAAGTMVIKEQAAVALTTLGAATPTKPPTDAEIEGWRARFPALSRMTAGDYELIRETLRRHDQGQVQTPMLFRLAEAIARKVDTLPPARDWQSSRRFLYDTAEAYRNLIE
jgi:uncharacterized RDD family membrane protein YckC